jgi:hypothetical protein
MKKISEEAVFFKTRFKEEAYMKTARTSWLATVGLSVVDRSRLAMT